MDFAGSTAVHSVGAWIALVGAYILGPRLGRYKPDGTIKSFKPYNIAISVLGVFILWLGWFGFNGGSTLAFSDDVDNIIINTTVCAIVGGLASFFHCFFFQSKSDIYEKFIGGILGGLVAVTASCNIITIGGAIGIGLIAGLVHNLSFDLVAKKWKIDDPVGAIPVHGFCGALGTILLAVFGAESALSLPRWEQLGIQVFGVAICFVWSAGLSYITFKMIEKAFGLRLSPEEEKSGVSIPGMLELNKEEEEDLDMDLIRNLMKE